MLDPTHQLPPVHLAHLPFLLWSKVWSGSWLLGWPRTVLAFLLLRIWRSSRRGGKLETMFLLSSSHGERSSAASEDCGLGKLQQPSFCALEKSLHFLSALLRMKRPWSSYRRKRLKDGEGKTTHCFWSCFNGQNWGTWQSYWSVELLAFWELFRVLF